MIEIYGSSHCSWCDRAIQICEQHGLKYTYKSLDDRFDGEQNLTEFRTRLPDAKTVPQVFWADRYIGGFNDLAQEIENTRNFGQDRI